MHGDLRVHGLVEEARKLRYSRRQVLKRGAALGLSATAVGAVLQSTGHHVVAQQAPQPRGGEQVSFTYLRPTWGPATYTANGPYEQELERLGNVAIEVQIIPVIDFDTRINTVLASGEIPDVIWGGGPGQQIWKDAQDQGAFAPINQFLDTYTAVRDAVPAEIWDLLRDQDGNIFFIPNLIYPVVPFFSFYRQDIFEAKGLAEPKTVDEFIATLEQLTGDPNVAPLSMGYTWHAKDIGTAFGFGLFGWQPAPDDPNRLMPWFDQEPQMNLHYWFQDLHERGLLDANYGVNPEPNFSTDRFKAGEVVVATENWLGFPDIVTNLRKVVPDARVGVLPPLAPEAGTRIVFPIDRGFYVSAQMGNPDGFFNFLNWTLTEGNVLRRWGVEGKTYTAQNDRNVPIPDVDREAGYKGPQIEPLSFLGPFSEKLDWETMQSNFEAAGVADQFEYIRGKFEEYGTNHYPDYRNPMIISPTEGEQGTRLFEDILRPVIDSVIINHERTPADWTSALQRWKDDGGAQIIEEVNQLQEDKSKPTYGV
jgi:putative aldouronate transport system substrate-binding protein